MAAAAVSIIAILGINSRAAGGPHVTKVDNTYTAQVSTAPARQNAVEAWGYVIRANSECSSDVFTEIPEGYNGNLTEVVYGSNTYTPANQAEIDKFDGSYICFLATYEDEDLTESLGIQLQFSEDDGAYGDGWPEVPVEFPANWDDLTSTQKIELNPYDCPEPVQINAESGRCILDNGGGQQSTTPAPVGTCPEGTVRGYSGGCHAPVAEGEPCDLGGIGNSQGQCAPCPVGDGYVIVDKTCTPGESECPADTIVDPEGGCVAAVEEGEPCDLQGIGNSEGLCVPCPTSDGYVLVNNTCVPEVGDGPVGQCPADTYQDSDGECHGYEEEEVSDDVFAVAAAGRFDDVSYDDSYATGIGFLLEHEITTGCDDDSFCPDDNLTRQEFVTFLYRLIDQRLYGVTDYRLGSEIFNDVSPGSYADVAIGWAYEEGITTGCDDDSFCPEDELSNAQIATFLYRAADGLDDFGHVSLVDIDDVDENAYYTEAVSWAVTYGVMEFCRVTIAEERLEAGITGLEFCPDALVTRGEAATILYNSHLNL